MKDIICPKCGEKQWSILDCNYVKLFKVCWNCDYKKWLKGELETFDFTKKEKQAYNQSIK